MNDIADVELGQKVENTGSAKFQLDEEKKEDDDIVAQVRISESPAVINSTVVKKSGCHLRWCRIKKTVEVREVNAGLLRSSIGAPTASQINEIKKDGPQMKTILKEVSGSAAPGEILALMGPSGSGKTSILDVLSGRSAYNEGTISLDGNPVTTKVMKKLKKKIAYVKQSDLFFGHLTVRDQLTYTAFLRLPSEWAKSRKIEEVDRIINVLRLNSCADTPIFLLSGGERKRVNIGTELLTDPIIVLLDEPTSGLDSTTAQALIKILDSLAVNEGKTIITSIHQPSSGVFFGFHKLMLLADGNLVYYGNPLDSLTYVKSLNLECPSGYNAADHWMDLLVVDSAVDSSRRSRAPAGMTTRAQLIKAWDQETFSKEVESLISSDLAENQKRRLGAIENLSENSFNTSWW